MRPKHPGCAGSRVRRGVRPLPHQLELRAGFPARTARRPPCTEVEQRVEHREIETGEERVHHVAEGHGQEPVQQRPPHSADGSSTEEHGEPEHGDGQDQQRGVEQRVGDVRREFEPRILRVRSDRGQATIAQSAARTRAQRRHRRRQVALLATGQQLALRGITPSRSGPNLGSRCGRSARQCGAPEPSLRCSGVGARWG